MARRFSGRRMSMGSRATKWKKNHWAVSADAVVLSSPDEIVFVALLTGDEYGSSDFVQARVTERRMRGWFNYDLAQQPVTGTTELILMSYIALLDESAVDAAIAAGGASLNQYDPSLDEAYSGNDIMWTGGGVIQRSQELTLADPHAFFSRNYAGVLDIPVSRRLEGDEGLFLVYQASGAFEDLTMVFTHVFRTLFQE